jgi:hypothetical protein
MDLIGSKTKNQRSLNGFNARVDVARRNITTTYLISVETSLSITIFSIHRSRALEPQPSQRLVLYLATWMFFTSISSYYCK